MYRLGAVQALVGTGVYNGSAAYRGNMARLHPLGVALQSARHVSFRAHMAATLSYLPMESEFGSDRSVE